VKETSATHGNAQDCPRSCTHGNGGIEERCDRTPVRLHRGHGRRTRGRSVVCAG
jgi:hypothetical protein